MIYKAISADGHVNEPPNLFEDRLPVKFRGAGTPCDRDAQLEGPRLGDGGSESAVGTRLRLHVFPVVQTG